LLAFLIVARRRRWLLVVVASWLLLSAGWGMIKVRRKGRTLVLDHLITALEAQDPDFPESRRWVAETLLRWWQSKELSISAKWIGIWTTTESTRFAQDIVERHQSVSWSGKPISKALVYLYRPIIATTIFLYRIRSQIFSGTICNPCP
jgi:hypothetical protein